MPDTYVVKDQYATYFMTFRVVQWLDVFSRRRYCEIFVNALNHCVEKKGLVVYAWVIMTNHVHLIVRSSPGKASDTIRDLKRHTARKIIDSISNDPESRRNWLLQVMRKEARRRSKNSKHQFWAFNSHAVELPPTFHSMLASKVFYIHDNPVKAGLVSSPEDFLYSSARDYAGKKGLVNVEIVNFGLGRI